MRWQGGVMRKNLKLALDNKIKACRKCPGMNRPRVTESAPGFGDIFSPIMIVGQSLCTPCMETQIPFTAGCGLILDKVFDKCGILKKHIFITNLVHCHPINNRVSKQFEIENCLPYLWREIKIVNPLLIVGLGTDVRNTLAPSFPFNYPAYWANGELEGRNTLFVYHPAYYYRREGVAGKGSREYIDYLAYQLGRFL